MSEKVKIDITTWAVIKVILIIAIFYFLYMIIDIIALLFIVLILAASFRPVVNKWGKTIGNVPAVIALLLIFVALLSTVIYLIIPPVVTQIKQLVNVFPDILNRYDILKNYSPIIKNNLSSATNNLGNVTGGFLAITAGIFGGVVSFVSAIFMTVYLLLDTKNNAKDLSNVLPENKRETIVNIIQKITNKVGDWFRGQMILCLIIAVLVWIGLSILNVPYALTLAVIAGIFEIIPTIGPIISGFIAALIALSVSPLIALLVVVLFIIIHQLENAILVPKIMQKAVGLSPVIVILAVLTGAKVLGITGAILAVPIAASILVIIQQWSQIKSIINQK